MTSLDTSGTSTKPQPERAENAVRAARERAARGPLHVIEERPVGSPDPFLATDRYRLTMPYAERI